MDLCLFRDSSGRPNDPNISTAAARNVIYVSSSIGGDEVERPTELKAKDRKGWRVSCGQRGAEGGGEGGRVGGREREGEKGSERERKRVLTEAWTNFTFGLVSVRLPNTRTRFFAMY